MILSLVILPEGGAGVRRFIGRAHELGVLRDALERILSTPDAVQPGECILIRGRRRVGKSSLVEEFLRTAEVPYVFFTAAGRSPEDELTELAEAVAASALPDRELFAEEAPAQWSA